MVIDTNVILRYLLRDDSRLFVEASKVFESAEPLRITDVVIMECVYVMEGTYGKKRGQVAEAINVLLRQNNVVYETGLAARYLELYANHKIDLADAYLIALALEEKEPLKTFDKKMQRVYEAEKAN